MMKIIEIFHTSDKENKSPLHICELAADAGGKVEGIAWSGEGYHPLIRLRCYSMCI